MKKRFALVGMLAVMALWGCGQGEKQAEAPPAAATPPAAVEQAAPPVAQETAVKPAEPAAPAAPAAAEKPAAPPEKAAPKAEAKPAVKEPLAPETVTLNPKQGTITLPHKKHADTHGCKTCHGDQTTPGPMPLGKEKGHALCQGCHKKMQAGPTACFKCHQKKG